LPLDLLAKKIPAKTDQGSTSPHIAILVGESHISQLLTFLDQRLGKSGIVICVDIGLNVLLHIQIQLDCIRRAKDVSDCKNQYREQIRELNATLEQAYKDELNNIAAQITSAVMSAAAIKEYFASLFSGIITNHMQFANDAACDEFLRENPFLNFLDQIDNIAELQRSLARLKIVTLNINLFDLPVCQVLGHILRQCKLVMMNLTNVGFYDNEGMLQQTVPAIVKNADPTNTVLMRSITGGKPLFCEIKPLADVYSSSTSASVTMRSMRGPGVWQTPTPDDKTYPDGGTSTPQP